jgi:TRAP-type C4-dicarboxylate transport system permease small subunit
MSDNIEQDFGFEEKTLKPKGLFDKIVIRSFEWIVVFTSLALAILISVAAFTRYVLHGDLYGYEEWVKLLAFWLYFMGGAYGAYNNTHVSADVIDAYLPAGKLHQTAVFIRQIMTSVLSFIFVYFGYYFFMFGLLGPLPKDVLTVGWNGTNLTFNLIDLWKVKAIARTTVWQIPLWTSYAAIFIGLIFMFIYFTRRCIHTGIALFSGKEGGKGA